MLTFHPMSVKSPVKAPLLALDPAVIADIATGAVPAEKALKRAGLPDDLIRAVISDPTFKKRLEQEKSLLDRYDDPDVYYNRICYQILRNKLVVLAEAGELPPDALIKATEMLHRHARMGGDESRPLGSGGPVLNIIIGGRDGEPEKRIAIATVDEPGSSGRPAISAEAERVSDDPLRAFDFELGRNADLVEGA